MADQGKKSDKEGRFRPLAMQADVKITDVTAELSAIKLSPADASDGSTLIDGTVKAEFGDRLKVNADFDSPRLNLDALVGAQSLEVWRAGGVLAILNQLMARFPTGLELSTSFKANVLTTGSETLENVEIKAQTERDAIRIQRIAANLPGRSRILADGIVFQTDGSADFGGKLALESNDLRLLTQWLWPSAKSVIATQWAGSRGQIKLQSDINWSESRVGFSALDFELDGERGSGTVLIGTGPTPTLDVKLSTRGLNFDTYLGKNSTLDPTAVVGWMVKPDVSKRITLDAADVTLNGTVAQNVLLDAEAGVGGLNLKTFTIGSVGGAQVSANGRLVDTDGTYEGNIDSRVTADDPNPFLRLIGVQPDGTVLPWQRILGKTSLTGQLVFKRGTEEPDVSYRVEGQSGPLDVSLSARMRELSSPDGVLSRGALRVTSPQSGNILKLFGLDPKHSSDAEGALTIAFDGNAPRGYAIESEASAYGATASFNGTYQPTTTALPALDGAIKLSAPNAQSLLSAMGVPFAAALPGAITASAVLKPQLEVLRFQDVKIEHSGQSLTGEVALSNDYSVTADVAGGSADITHILAASFLPWDGREPNRDTSFADRAPFGLNGEIWYRPQALTLWPGNPVSEAVVGINVEGRERQVTVAGRDTNGDAVSFESAVLPADGQYTLATSGRIPVDLAKSLLLADGANLLSGRALIEFKASGIGLSTLAALSDFKGNGTVKLSQTAVANYAPATFANLILAVTTSDELRAAVASLQGNETLALADGPHAFTVTAGRAALTPISFSQGRATLAVTGEADLVEKGFAATLKLRLTERPELPSVDLQLTGSAGKLRKRVETSQLAGKLGYDIMAREMAELERVQAEQQRAIEQEEAQRKLDDDRYQAYLEQRAELRLRQRELKVHAEQRSLEAKAFAARLQDALPFYAAMNKLEIAKRLREARLLSQLVNGQSPKPIISKRDDVIQLPDGVELPKSFDLDGVTP